MLLILFPKLKIIAQNKESITFCKSQKKYKAKRYLKRYYFLPDVLPTILKKNDKDYGYEDYKNFPIYFDKRQIKLDSATIHLFTFGYYPKKHKKDYFSSYKDYKKNKWRKSNGNYISFSCDSIFIHPLIVYNHDDELDYKKDLILVLSENFNDTIGNAHVYFEKKMYYNQIKDSIYIFKVDISNTFKDPNLLLLSDIYTIRGEMLRIKEFGISKKYGFVFVKNDFYCLDPRTEENDRIKYIELETWYY